VRRPVVSGPCRSGWVRAGLFVEAPSIGAVLAAGVAWQHVANLSVYEHLSRSHPLLGRVPSRSDDRSERLTRLFYILLTVHTATLSGTLGCWPRLAEGGPVVAIVETRISVWEALAGRAPGQPLGPADPGLWSAVAERVNPARARPVLRAGV